MWFFTCQKAKLKWWIHFLIFFQIFFYSPNTQGESGFFLCFLSLRENVEIMSCIVFIKSTLVLFCCCFKHWTQKKLLFLQHTKLLKNVWKAFIVKSVHIHKNKLLAGRDEWSLKMFMNIHRSFHGYAVNTFSPFARILRSFSEFITGKLIKNPFAKQNHSSGKTYTIMLFLAEGEIN